LTVVATSAMTVVETRRGARPEGELFRCCIAMLYDSFIFHGRGYIRDRQARPGYWNPDVRDVEERMDLRTRADPDLHSVVVACMRV
jgi:hypothetical protein